MSVRLAKSGASVEARGQVLGLQRTFMGVIASSMSFGGSILSRVTPRTLLLASWLALGGACGGKASADHALVNSAIGGAFAAGQGGSAAVGGSKSATLAGGAPLQGGLGGAVIVGGLGGSVGGGGTGSGGKPPACTSSDAGYTTDLSNIAQRLPAWFTPPGLDCGAMYDLDASNFVLRRCTGGLVGYSWVEGGENSYEYVYQNGSLVFGAIGGYVGSTCGARFDLPLSVSTGERPELTGCACEVCQTAGGSAGSAGSAALGPAPCP
ncbi:MAG: hypothetical protein SFV15_06325 [Polyangiaceae bacterium]|nr:hypothetical protein [Polyangiaceae bacterium]